MVSSGGFPSLSTNPFDLRPLEANDRDLMVGRDEDLERLQWSFQHATGVSMAMVTGPPGSGRTSLLRVLAGPVRRAVHIVDVERSSDEATALMLQIHASFVGGGVPATAQMAMEQIIGTLRRDGTQALVVIDLPVSDAERLSHLLMRAMPYLERLEALVVVAMTPEQAAQMDPSLLDRFNEDISLKPLDSEGIAGLIDARVRRHAPGGWRPTTDWVRDHLGVLAMQPREVLRDMRRKYDEHRRQAGNGEQRPSRTTSTSGERPGGTWVEGVEPQQLELNLEGLEESREQDAPLPPRPHVEAVSEDETSWFEDLGGGGLAEPAEAEADKPAENEPHMYSSVVDSSSMFGRLAKRSEAANAGHLRVKTNPEEAEGPTLVEEGFEWTEYGEEEDIASPPKSPTTPPPLHTDHGRDEALEGLRRELLAAVAAVESGGGGMVQQVQLSGLVEALTALGRPHPGEATYRPLNVEALLGLNRGQAIVVDVSSRRSVSPSDPALLRQLGVKRARLSQLCNGLHREGILDVAKQGRERVFSLSAAARGQLKAWKLLGGEA